MGKSVAAGPTEFAAIADQVRKRHRQGNGGDVEGIALDCRYILDQSPLIDVGKIKKPGEPTNMLTILCKSTSPVSDTAEIVTELIRYWEAELRYPFFAAHAVEYPDTGVIFHFITVQSSNGHYVVGKILVDLRPTMFHESR